MTRHSTAIYVRARVRARKTPAVLLRRRERRLVAELRRGPRNPEHEALLAATRAALAARNPGSWS
jgi:hypothetical protein